ncbi:MAG: hypothetical protein NC300_11690 [Bacteroidales bacterium]|nr:hypothetical protein [Bacteroidales bacterium]
MLNNRCQRMSIEVHRLEYKFLKYGVTSSIALYITASICFDIYKVDYTIFVINVNIAIDKISVIFGRNGDAFDFAYSVFPEGRILFCTPACGNALTKYSK